MKVYAKKWENGKVTDVDAVLYDGPSVSTKPLARVFVTKVDTRAPLCYDRHADCEYPVRSSRISLRV